MNQHILHRTNSIFRAEAFASFDSFFLIVRKLIRMVEQILDSLIQRFLAVFSHDAPFVVLTQHFLHARNFNGADRRSND